MKPVSLKPEPLPNQGKIGIIAPASPAPVSDIQPGIDLLSAYGYSIVTSSHIYAEEDYLAGADNDRVMDLHQMFQDPGIQAIFCTRGGYGSLRLLDKINFDLIQRHPKILVGYSDITCLLLALYAKTGLVTFHGPVIKEFHLNNKKNFEFLLRFLSSNETLTLSFAPGCVLMGGKATGNILGGNLSLLCHLIGTPYFPSMDGALLFLEERGESLYRLDRMLTHLRLSGRIEKIRGLLVGSFENCGDIEAINRLLLEWVSDLDIPVAGGLPFGHGRENLTLPFGVQATMNTEHQSLTFKESCFRVSS